MPDPHTWPPELRPALALEALRNAIAPSADPEVRFDADRFWAKVDKSDIDGCWEWQGTLTGRPPRMPYGVFHGVRIDGRVTQQRAHRLSYYLATGEWPGELFVCHRCDNPRCVNPSHLWLGTNEDNQRDKIEKGRAVNHYTNRTECPRGHPYGPPNRAGTRACRECQKVAQREWKRKQRAKQPPAMREAHYEIVRNDEGYFARFVAYNGLTVWQTPRTYSHHSRVVTAIFSIVNASSDAAQRIEVRDVDERTRKDGAA